jgi:proline iminopeptidase
MREAADAADLEVTMKLVLAFGCWFLTLLPACLDPSEDGNLVPKTADEDPSIPQRSFNGSTFHLETFGDPSGPVIVMLHGGPGLDYRGLLRLRNEVDGERLEDHHLVVFWDQRSAGLSRRHAESEITIDAYDADLTWILDELSPGRPAVLVSQSWGGMYATRYIAHHPEKVAGAVLMEPGPLTGELFSEIAGEIQKLDFFSEWLNDLAWAEHIVTPSDHARADYLRALGSYGNSEPALHHSTADRMPFWRLGAVVNVAFARSGIAGGKPVYDFTQGLDRFTKPVPSRRARSTPRPASPSKSARCASIRAPPSR